jgi:hypothetical protein
MRYTVISNHDAITHWMAVDGKKGTDFAYCISSPPSLFDPFTSLISRAATFSLSPRQLLTYSLKSVTITGCFVVGRRLDVQPGSHL